MPVCRATAEDLPAVEAVYAAAIDAMRHTPLDILWDLDLHPSRAWLREAALAGDLFVAHDGAGGRALGAFVIDGEQDADYAQAPWRAGTGPGEALVLHVLVVAPDARGRGTGRELVAAAADEARRRGAHSLRLDVFDNNGPAAALYRACGFSDLGAFALEHNGEFAHVSHLMELAL